MTHRTSQDAGFSLIEVVLAMGILTVGALALLSAVSIATRQLTGSQDQLLASQRATEAVESVFKARDNRVLTWAQIRNVAGLSGADGGVFIDGPRQVRDPGADGLINTSDDGSVTQMIRPGPDGLLGTPDDTSTALFNFTREVEIRDISANLRQVRVIVRYQTPRGTEQYVLTTYLSAYA